MDSPGIILQLHRKLDTATGATARYVNSFAGDGIAAPDEARAPRWRGRV